MWALCCCASKGRKRRFVFFGELRLQRLKIPPNAHTGSRRHALRELEGLRGPETFEAVLYMNLAVGDAGATGLLMHLCSVNAGHEKRTRAPKKWRNIGKKQKSSSVCLVLCAAYTGSNLKCSGDFVSHCVPLAWGVHCFRAHTSRQRFGAWQKYGWGNVRQNIPAERLENYPRPVRISDSPV